jgi:hypothetical protein
MEAIEAVAGATSRGPRLTRAGREALGKRLLAMQPADRRHLGRTAKAMGMSSTWLRALRARARRGHVERPAGRPRLDDAERARVRSLVSVERERQGATAGWRPIHKALSAREPDLSVMLVQAELAALKREARAARQREVESVREGYEILGRDTMWAEDTTHMGRLAGGDEVTGELLRDRATLSTVSLTVGGAPTAASVEADLERAANDRGGWPLVLQHDNASVYEAQRVVERTARERVVRLRSRVHTPTDNPATEYGHGELKGESALGKGAIVRSDAEAAARLDHACRVLDGGRPRASRGWHTALELGRIVPRGDAHVDRAVFYAAACSAMQTAVLGLTDPDAVRKAERDAILQTLCRFGLARRHVGLRPREGSPPTPFRPSEKE